MRRRHPLHVARRAWAVALPLILILVAFAACGRKLLVAGNSVVHRVSVADCVELYLDALCNGRSEVICMLTPPETLKLSGQYGTLDAWLERRPEACDLVVTTIPDLARDEPSWFELGSRRGVLLPVVLARRTDPSCQFLCSFMLTDGRIFLVDPIHPADDVIP